MQVRCRLDAETAWLDAESARLDAESARLDAESARLDAGLANPRELQTRISEEPKKGEPM
jgi:hypothetical protein